MGLRNLFRQKFRVMATSSLSMNQQHANSRDRKRKHVSSEAYSAGANVTYNIVQRNYGKDGEAA